MSLDRRRDQKDEGYLCGGNQKRDDSYEDSSLTREKQQSSGMKTYNVKDNTFASFQEISSHAVSKL